MNFCLDIYLYLALSEISPQKRRRGGLAETVKGKSKQKDISYEDSAAGDAIILKNTTFSRI